MSKWSIRATKLVINFTVECYRLSLFPLYYREKNERELQRDCSSHRTNPISKVEDLYRGEDASSPRENSCPRGIFRAAGLSHNAGSLSYTDPWDRVYHRDVAFTSAKRKGGQWCVGGHKRCPRSCHTS